MQQRTCPNCGQPIDAAAVAGSLCPNCGAALPPLPEVGKSDIPDVPMITGIPFVDGILGFLTFLASGLVYGLGILLFALPLYFIFRDKKPYYARGIRVGFLLLLILFLGGLAFCGMMMLVYR